MDTHDTNTPSVKAYEVGRRIVVKFYDGPGLAEELHCPHCHWSGHVELALNALSAPSDEMHCPDCNTKLGIVAATSLLA